MKVITSLSILRANDATKAPWPHVAKHLVVLVWQSDQSRDLLAVGVDPDHRHGQIVFEAELPPARLSAFLKAVIDSERGEIEHHCHKLTPMPGDHHAPETRPLLHKASLALARTLRSDEGLAEAVVNPAPPRPRCEPPVKQR